MTSAPPSDGTDSCDLTSAMREALAKRLRRGELRRLTPAAELAGLVDFSSNDYLGLAATDEVRRHRLSWSRKLGDESLKRGATGSRLLSGNSYAAEVLEQKLAEFHDTQAALLFNSGYDANLALIASARIGPSGLFLYDERIHASTHDGLRMMRQSRAEKFRHNDVGDLRRRLYAFRAQSMAPIVVLLEAVYSMEGSVAPLGEIAVACREFSAWFVVDEAHSVGVVGRHGVGLSQELAVHNHSSMYARVVTFGKAIGSHGAAVLGTNLLKEYLVNFARPLIYSTALPPESLLSVLASYEALKDVEFLRKELDSNICMFQGMARSLGLKLASREAHPIQAVLVPGARKCVSVANRIRKDCRFLVFPIRSPTVEPGGEMLRIVIHSWNEKDDLRKLLIALANAIGRDKTYARL